jgi:Gas vesicle protein
MRTDIQPTNHRVSGLVDVLDRVLDKGLAIAGDIKVSLAEVELLTIRIRLIVCSIDKAQEIGLDWWKHDRYFAPGARGAESDALWKQLRQLEQKVAALTAGRAPVRRRARRGRAGNEHS